MKSDFYAEVNKKFNIRREKAKQTALMRKEQVYTSIPEIREIDGKMSSLAFEMYKSVSAGEEPETAAENFRTAARECNERKRQLLLRAGLRADYLDTLFYCKKCNDTGLVEGKRCECYSNLLTKELMEHSCLTQSMKKQTFDAFSLDYYSRDNHRGETVSPADNMRSILNECKSFAASFGKKTRNLLFYGSPGLGKTFLSSAIANEVMRRGFTVIYQSAGSIFSELEDVKFRGRESTIAKELLNVDLIIIDDLGTEFISTFSEAEFFKILNSRINSEKSIIISTNLSLRDIKTTYSERILSRIVGKFDALKFYGEDIRLKEAMKK